MIQGAEIELPSSFRLLIRRLLEHLKVLKEQVDEINAQIIAWHRARKATQRLEMVPGIGPLAAIVLVAGGDAKNFDNGRQFAT